MDDIAMEADKYDECGLSCEPVNLREEALGRVNGKPETDDKENNNGISTDETQAIRYNCTKEHEYVTVIVEYIPAVGLCVKVYTPLTLQ